MTTGEYCRPSMRGCTSYHVGLVVHQGGSTNIDIDYILVTVVVHLLQHSSISQHTIKPKGPKRRTSCESVELPHPSMRIRAFLSGTYSRTRGAMSEKLLNQSNDVPSASLSRCCVHLLPKESEFGRLNWLYRVSLCEVQWHTLTE
jgi:hypothetical protein